MATNPVEQDDSSEINLTPMLDVVFIMLIFFLVAATFVREHGLDLETSEGEPQDVPASEHILVVIDESSRILIDGRHIDPRALRANLQRLSAERPDGGVIIQPHPKSANRYLVQVMDAARQAGIYDLRMAERQPLAAVVP